MDERVYEIVLYIVDSIDSSTEENILTQIRDISEGLVEKGYTEKEISSAFDILLESLSEEPANSSLKTNQKRRTNKKKRRSAKLKATKPKKHYIYQIHELDVIGEEEIESIIRRSLMSGKYSTSIPEIKAMINNYLFDPNELQSNSFFVVTNKHYGN